MHSLTLLLCILLFGVITTGVEGAVNTTVQTNYGWVSGFTSATHKIWYGIPYARPPTGALRWQMPSFPATWKGIRQSTIRGASCPQPDTPGASEDCLYLNVFTPIRANRSLPVYVWIHGGSFWGGNGGTNGQFLSGEDMVFVAMNYRLGAFGYIQLPELMANTAQNTGGFFGIQDQRLALRWVKENIAAFNGDPTKVTLAGQSAGAVSVCTHVAAPRSAYLFQQAVMESGNCNGLTPNTSGIASSRVIANKLNCTGAAANVVACLYNKTTAEIVAATSGPIWPVLHEYELPVQPIERIRSGSYFKVPMLIGTNKDEQSFQTCTSYKNINEVQYNTTLRSLFGSSLAPYVYKMYPSYKYNPLVNGITASWSDRRFKCPSFDMIDAMSTSNPYPLFFYSFIHTNSFQSDPACSGATHSAELAYLYPSSLDRYTAAEKNLTTIMRQWWSSFIVSRAPVSSAGRVGWTRYNRNTRSFMQIDDVLPGMRTRYNGDFCDFWQSPTTPIGASTTGSPIGTSTTGI